MTKEEAIDAVVANLRARVGDRATIYRKGVRIVIEMRGVKASCDLHPKFDESAIEGLTESMMKQFFGEKPDPVVELLADDA